MLEFIIIMLICNVIVAIPLFIWFWTDTAEVRRLHKLSKEENKKNDKR